MPLIHSSSESALRENIATEVRARGPENTRQAVAIALDTGRRAWRKSHPTGPFPHHLRLTGAHRASRSSRNSAISDIFKKKPKVVGEKEYDDALYRAYGSLANLERVLSEMPPEKRPDVGSMNMIHVILGKVEALHSK